MAIMTFDAAYHNAKQSLKILRELYFDAIVKDMSDAAIQDIGSKMFDAQTSFERTTFLYNKRRKTNYPITIEENE